MRARPVYWLVLALAIGCSVGLRVLAQHTQASDWQPAVYRYNADSSPECDDVAGSPPPALRDAGRWFRITLPDTPRLSPRGCLLHGRLPV